MKETLDDRDTEAGGIEVRQNSLLLAKPDTANMFCSTK